jgi:hypothetical protein
MLYVDCEGDPDLHLRLRGHIGECPACAKWFAERQRLDEAVCTALVAGSPTPELWARVLSKAGIRSAHTRRKRWPVVIGVLSLAAAALVALVIVPLTRRSPSTELARNAAEWHQQWTAGNVHPDFLSTSDQEVDRYLKANVSFRVHCPPRTDVDFTVQGAGVCSMKNQRQAAYIVGHVGEVPVSILVLDRRSVEATPHQGFHHCREGSYQVAYGVIADNLVLVTGTTSPDILERLLNAYGSYPDG